MPITIDGNGSIGGLVAGGLPDATVATADLVDASVTPTKLSQPMTLMTAQNATGTSIDFTGIPVWAKRITVMFNGVSTNGTSSIQVQIGTAGGIETTGYSASSSGIGLNTAASVASTAGFITNATAAAETNSGQGLISFLGNNNWAFISAVARPSVPATSLGVGSKTLTGTLDRVRITTVNGTDTFDAGSINVLYEG